MPVAVPKPNNVSDDGRGGSRPRVGEPSDVPIIWVLEVLEEEIPHYRVEPLRDLAVRAKPRLHALALDRADLISAL